MSTWIAFSVAPQQESNAHDALVRAGIESIYIYELREVERRRHRSVVEKIERRPLLTGYALARHDPAEPLAYWQMRIAQLSYYAGPQRGRLPVVRAVVGHISGGDQALDHLKAYSGSTVAMPRAKQLKPGDAAKVTGGPFEGVPVVIEATTKTHGRVVLGSVTVNIPLDLMEAA